MPDFAVALKDGVSASRQVPDVEGYVAVPENLGSYIMVRRNRFATRIAPIP